MVTIASSKIVSACIPSIRLPGDCTPGSYKVLVDLAIEWVDESLSSLSAARLYAPEAHSRGMRGVVKEVEM